MAGTRFGEQHRSAAKIAIVSDLLMVRYIVSVIALIFAGCPSHLSFAAEVKVIPPSDTGTALVLIAGPIVPGDAKQFEDATEGVNKAIVIFSSPGGILVEGLSIGANIREKGYITAVAENTLCASACALAWLGGDRRAMANSSKIGFHAAYVKTGQYKRESGVDNAIVGAYLNQLGLSLDAIRYITTPGPDEIQWLSIRDAIRYGISVYSLENTLLGSSSNGAAKSLTSGGYKTAVRAAENFDNRFRSCGIAGLSASVKACYERAAELRTINSVQYCFTLDLLSSDLSAWAYKTQHFPIEPYFTSSQTNNRVQQILDSLGYTGNRGALLSEWQDLTAIANLGTAANHSSASQALETCQ
jgi:hypothetical protein